MNSKNLSNPGKWYTEFDEKGNCTKAVYDVSYRRLLGYESEEEYANAQETWTGNIHPEDEERVNEHLADCLSLHPEGMDYDIEYRMMTKSGYRWFHDYGHCFRREDGSVSLCDGVVFDIQDTVDKHRQYTMLVESFSAEYDMVDIIDLNDGSLISVKNHEELNGLHAVSGDFTKAFLLYARNLVYEDDRDFMLHETDIETIRSRALSEKNYSVNYRTQIGNEIFWNKMAVVLSGENSILIGFVQKNIEILEEQIRDKTYADYFCAFVVNLDSLTATVVKESPYFNIGKAGSRFPYVEMILKFAQTLEEKPREFFLRMADVEFVRRDLAVDNDRSYSYKSTNIEGGKWVSVISYVLSRHPDGRPLTFSLGFVLMDTVGADRQELQSKLEATIQRNNLLHDFVHASQWSYEISADGEVLSAAYDNLANERTAVSNKNPMEWVEYLHPDDKEKTLEKFMKTARDHSGNTPYDVSYRIMTTYGDYRWAKTSGRLIPRKDGTAEFIGISISIHDQITEQEKHQAQLTEALAMAQSANRAKTTFLNNMSHDIRTPMNAIIGYTGLAASHIDNKAQVQDYLSKIAQSSDHLLSLINDVLDMSRIESGKMNLNEREENLPEIIHTLRDIVQADIHAKQHDFFIDTVNVNDDDIICDKLRLNQVLLNILSNSIKYTAAGGTVSMRITEKSVKPNGYATFEFRIKDNGMGMDPEFVKTIFEPFTRVKSSTVSGIQGTGLGMAITKNIIDMMGGKIDNRSELGKGTETLVTFDFKLQTGHKEVAVIPELQGIRGLVVDDDTNTCLSVSGMLNDIGMRYEWCVSGREAVIRAEAAYNMADPFKVYIIDWLMPDMNGIETVRRIRKVIGTDTPMIILTSYDWSDVEDEAREAGVTAFLNKPMFPSDLHRVLSRFFGKAEEPQKAEAILYDFTGKKILLVEDNELNREIAEDILTEDGFIIDLAEDGTVAVEKMKKAQPGDYDLILMDIQMPVMDGYEATRQIRDMGTEISKLPIIAMTANAFEEDRQAALAAGMSEHIAKPIAVAKLKALLARFL